MREWPQREIIYHMSGSELLLSSPQVLDQCATAVQMLIIPLPQHALCSLQEEVHEHNEWFIETQLISKHIAGHQSTDWIRNVSCQGFPGNLATISIKTAVFVIHILCPLFIFKMDGFVSDQIQLTSHLNGRANERNYDSSAGGLLVLLLEGLIIII